MALTTTDPDAAIELARQIFRLAPSAGTVDELLAWMESAAAQAIELRLELGMLAVPAGWDQELADFGIRANEYRLEVAADPASAADVGHRLLYDKCMTLDGYPCRSARFDFQTPWALWNQLIQAQAPDQPAKWTDQLAAAVEAKIRQNFEQLQTGLETIAAIGSPMEHAYRKAADLAGQAAVGARQYMVGKAKAAAIGAGLGVFAAALVVFTLMLGKRRG